ncbi:MAG: acyl-homoserine-lactone synthase [Pseudomonadota bacterium]
MYFFINGDQLPEYPHLRQQMFRLRARVFREALKWVDGDGDREIDKFDSMNPVYVMHTDDAGEELFACGRLMPTSGPTLLSEVFGATVPDLDFTSPFVWEITRLCMDDDLIRARGRDDDRFEILRSLHVAALEFGLGVGVDTYLANFDSLRHRMWRRMGVKFDIIGKTDTFSTPVYLGITPCTRAILNEAREALGSHTPLLQTPPTPVAVPIEIAA